MKPINVIFDGPPSHISGRFVEVETDDGKSISVGEWIEKSDGFWALRITDQSEQDALTMALRLYGEDPETFSPECREVMARWESGILAVLDGKQPEKQPIDCEYCAWNGIPEGK
jgi:hypothetical protein